MKSVGFFITLDKTMSGDKLKKGADENITGGLLAAGAATGIELPAPDYLLKMSPSMEPGKFNLSFITPTD